MEADFFLGKLPIANHGQRPVTGLWKPNPQKNLQVFLQILNLVNNAEILAPELVGGPSEMVV